MASQVHDHVRAGTEYDLESLLVGDDDDSIFKDYANCNYYMPDEFTEHVVDNDSYISYFHLNCRGLSSNWDAFQELILCMHSDHFRFDFIGISELYSSSMLRRLQLSGYQDLIAKQRIVRHGPGWRGGHVHGIGESLARAGEEPRARRGRRPGSRAARSCR